MCCMRCGGRRSSCRRCKSAAQRLHSGAVRCCIEHIARREIRVSVRFVVEAAVEARNRQTIAGVDVSYAMRRSFWTTHKSRVSIPAETNGSVRGGDLPVCSIRRP